VGNESYCVLSNVRTSMRAAARFSIENDDDDDDEEANNTTTYYFNSTVLHTTS